VGGWWLPCNQSINQPQGSTTTSTAALLLSGGVVDMHMLLLLLWQLQHESIGTASVACMFLARSLRFEAQQGVPNASSGMWYGQ
jgi:hypothetical protein